MIKATIRELRSRFNDDLQIIMNHKAHASVRRKALKDLNAIQSDLYDAGYTITVTIGVERCSENTMAEKTKS